MPAPIGTSLPVIAQVVEQQLLTFESVITSAAVCGDISNIYWVEDGEQPTPGRTGQRDVLLIERPDIAENIIGDGRFAMMSSGMDLALRSTVALDPSGNKKTFLIAHRLLIDALLDAMMGFFPVDDDNNALTIEGFILDGNAAPVKRSDSLTWGYTLSSYKFHYLPNINRNLLVT